MQWRRSASWENSSCSRWDHCCRFRPGARRRMAWSRPYAMIRVVPFSSGSSTSSKPDERPTTNDESPSNKPLLTSTDYGLLELTVDRLSRTLLGTHRGHV